MKNGNINTKKKIENQKNKSTKNILIKKQNGITLVALVVSIILMLVLAGVSLNATIGENGIISRAQESKLRKEEADIETEILSGVAALDTEYYDKVSADSGITINSIYSISGLSKYVKGKINGFSYNKDGKSTIYYTNELGSYTVIINKDGNTKTYSGIYLEKNQIATIQMEDKDKITLSTDITDIVWAVVSGDGTVNPTTGEVVKNGSGTIIIKGADTNGNEVTVIIKDSIENSVAENIDVTNAITTAHIGDKIDAYIIPGENGNNKLVIKGKGNIIQEFTMENAETVKEIIVEEGIVSIENGPFKNFPNTEIITIPSTVQKIWQVGTNLNKIKIVNYNAISAVPAIELSETAIESIMGFNSTDQFITLNIGKDVINIPEKFFSSCKKIRDVSFPENIRKIGDRAFYNCTNLQYIDLNSQIEEIGEIAFAYTGIKSILIPENIKKLSAGVFQDNYNLKKIIYNAINCEYNAREIENETTTTISPLFWNVYEDLDLLQKEVIIGENVKKIPVGVFAIIRNLKEMNIPKSVEIIEKYAFDKCTNLEKVILQDGIKEIEKFAFAYIPLKEVTIPSTVEIIEKQAFESCNNLTKLTYNAINCEYNGTKVINDIEYLYPLCSNNQNYNEALQEIIIGENVKKIPVGIFSIIKNLKEINIPKSVEIIEKYAFDKCTNLEKINLQDGIKEIGELAFAYTLVNEATIPSTVEKMGKYVFEGCDNLIKLTYNAINCEYDGKNQELNIVYPLCHQNNGNNVLKQIIIGKQVEKIPKGIFSYMKKLKEIDIPNSVKTIENEAFWCSGLEKITLNNGIEKLDDSSLGGTNIEQVIIPNSVKEMKYTFWECTFLKEIIVKQPENSIAGAPWSNVSGITVRWEP